MGNKQSPERAAGFFRVDLRMVGHVSFSALKVGQNVEHYTSKLKMRHGANFNRLPSKYNTAPFLA